jgi:copper(I)-binding protein
MTRLLSATLAFALLLVACAAPAGQIGSIRVENVWSRPAAAGSNGAVYFTLRNTGSADRLVAASSEVARTCELHKTMTEGGVARMAEVKAIEVPAGGSVELKPGSFHIMLIGLNRELRGGDKFPVTLTFESGATGTVLVEVRGNDPAPAH